jgi:AraC-like DNA-binding protein
MKKNVNSDKKNSIEFLRDIPDLIPVVTNNYGDWSIKTFNRENFSCGNYLSPSRRGFYKVVFVYDGEGEFTLGLNTYQISKPTILFIHPNDIISWKRTSEKQTGYYCTFQKELLDDQSGLKTIAFKNELFSNKDRSVILLQEESIKEIIEIFTKMNREENLNSVNMVDTICTYLQLIMLESLKNTDYVQPISTNKEFNHIYQFLELLEEHTNNISVDSPIKYKTAKEFATSMNLHPNYLNALVKKNTGQTVSAIITNRILEESQMLLLHTSLSLQEISFSMGFSDLPNFDSFFKNKTGISPSRYRKET